MLRISKLTDYAVLLTTQLVSHDEASSVRGLAAQSGLPEATVGKVLKKLTRAGVVRSQRGPRGGYRLARRRAEIPIVDVITALEGPIAVTECSDGAPSPACDYQDECSTRANWQRINQAVYEALASISLADMAGAEGPRLVRIRAAAPRIGAATRPNSDTASADADAADADSADADSADAADAASADADSADAARVYAARAETSSGPPEAEPPGGGMR